MTTFNYGGTQLETFGNITVVDGYLDIPERRGKNIVIPLSDGTVHTNKYWDERTITFGIAVIEATATALETKLDTIRTLLAPSAPQTLSMTLESSAVRTVLATVEKPIQTKKMSPTNARILVEFTVCSPYWRSDTIYEVTSDAIDGTPTPQTLTVVNGGSVQEMNPVLLLTGPLRNTVITNTTPTPDVILTYTGTIAGGATVTIQKTNGEYTAVHSGSGNVIGNVSHSGSPALMMFNVGSNAVTIADADYAGGTVKVSFYPAYL